MKWWPWRRAPEVVPVVTPPEEDSRLVDEIFFKRLQGQFNAALWSQDLMLYAKKELDDHCAKRHDYLSDCDPLCGPPSINDMLDELSREELHNLTAMLIKQWYVCFSTLRFNQRS